MPLAISIVANPRVSTAVGRNALTKRTNDGLPVHSFRSLLADLATVTHNTMAVAHQPDTTFVMYPQFTPNPGPCFPTPQRERQAVAQQT
jgi:hypothetical protein